MYFAEIVITVIVSVKTISFYVYTVDIQFIQYKKATTILDKTHVDTARTLVLLLRILIGTKIIRRHPLPQSMLAIVDAQNH